MTRSKLELAIILAKLRGKDEDPAKLASEMSLMKLCYEIQKVEEEREQAETVEEPQLTKKEETIVKEIKVPEKSTSREKHRHILSWLLDSSDEEA